MKLQKKWKFVVAFLVILSAIYLTHPLYLKALGYFLVVSDPMVKSDAIVVLDGDPMDERLLHSVAAHNANSIREETRYFLRFVRQQGFKLVEAPD